ncbi:MAG: carboxypeptidase-like regulatory domain-containing protein, partial [Bacteroidales bacterium]|nr:carboxypeptidase-like regulatory domain-containing protein [Bacteroidales bacterium]
MKSLFRKVILTAALIAASVSAMAQQVTASGVVKDTKGIPVIGASVIQTGTNNGVISDIDGTFSLNVPQGAILAVSSIGYKTVNVAAASDMEIILEDDNELLDEVVVVGYGVQKK